MACYRYQFERGQIIETPMNNIIENVIATVIVTVISAAVGLIFQAFGFSTQESIGAASLVLLVLVIMFSVTQRYYPVYVRWLTEQLLEISLNVKPNDTDEARKAFKRKIVERVLLENSGVELKENSSVVEFLNQEVCEPRIREASHSARKVKILTIRGERYFFGSRSLLHDLLSSKQVAGFNIEVLVLSPESQHITEELAGKLGHASAERIKEKMRIVVDYLKFLTSQNKSFEVKCYNETPNFKILLFDDIMFVSSFVGEEPKNDRSAKMLQITRDGNPLFTGLERYFDDLSKRSVSLQ